MSHISANNIVSQKRSHTPKSCLCCHDVYIEDTLLSSLHDNPHLPVISNSYSLSTAISQHPTSTSYTKMMNSFINLPPCDYKLLANPKVRVPRLSLSSLMFTYTVS